MKIESYIALKHALGDWVLKIKNYGWCSFDINDENKYDVACEMIYISSTIFDDKKINIGTYNQICSYVKIIKDRLWLQGYDF